MKNMDNLEELLASGELVDIIIALDNHISEISNYGEQLQILSMAQKNFYFNQCFERELNNGGFNQYFSNSSGNFAHQTILSLRAVGANATANILQQAIDQFPNGMVPTDRDQRNEVIESIEDSANEVWEQLDQKFYEYADDLSMLNMNYVNSHRSEF